MMYVSVTLQTLGASALLAAACGPAAFAQDRLPTLHQPQTQRPQQEQPKALHFVTGDDITDMSVVNPNGDEIGSISDLIVDRGSGEVKSVVVKSGGFLGIGGRSVAIPASAFKFNAHEGNAQIDMTEEQFQRYPQFDSADIEKGDPSFLDSMWKSITGEKDDPQQAKQDHFKHRVNPDDLRAVQGEITEVRRQKVDGTEFIVVQVDTGRGLNELLLGPSWYVMGHKAAPMRGMTIDAHAGPCDSGTLGQTLIVERATINETPLPLRHRDGSPAWTWSSEQESGGEAEATPYGARRVVLLSKIQGAEAECRGEPAGKLREVVVECRSGQIAFAAIDPDGKFLGIGATNRLVPWSVVSFGADNVARIDATKEMVEASNTMPDDVSRLATGDVYNAVYRAYGIQPPDFKPSTEDWRKDEQSNMWDEKGTIGKAAISAQPVRIRGVVVAVERNAMIGGAEPAYALLLNTPEGNRERVLFGPSWYFEKQKLDFPAGSDVTVDARRVEIDGQPCAIAWSIEHNGRTTRLWDGNRPVWNDGR